mmetsp:Transcript_78018/g.138228  ORF Transcript_78018/g.138228 Transcript_78018/m.138228 type:complete len:342 (-) Transcript_78018:955-1980(-)
MKLSVLLLFVVYLLFSGISAPVALTVLSIGPLVLRISAPVPVLLPVSVSISTVASLRPAPTPAVVSSVPSSVTAASAPPPAAPAASGGVLASLCELCISRAAGSASVPVPPPADRISPCRCTLDINVLTVRSYSSMPACTALCLGGYRCCSTKAGEAPGEGTVGMQPAFHVAPICCGCTSVPSHAAVEAVAGVCGAAPESRPGCTGAVRDDPALQAIAASTSPCCHWASMRRPSSSCFSLLFSRAAASCAIGRGANELTAAAPAPRATLAAASEASASASGSAPLSALRTAPLLPAPRADSNADGVASAATGDSDREAAETVTVSMDAMCETLSGTEECEA